MALCLIITLFPIFRLPFGGSVTIGKLLPLIFFTYFYGLKSGIFAGTIFSVFQIMISFHVPPAKTVFSFICVVLLDYMIPYLIIGFTAIFKNIFRNIKKCFSVSIVFSYFVRFLCGVFSGILIWREYIPKEYNIWVYSVVYNLIYILPEMLIALIVCGILLKFFIFKNANHTL